MTTVFHSPLGDLYITSGNDGIRQIKWTTQRELSEQRDRLHIDCHHQLQEYFEGKRKEFDLPLQLEGSSFQKEVWQKLLMIDYGHVRTYGELSKELGDVHKSRAVGSAIGANPIMIVVPCHRVVAKNEGLTGYAGGLGAKQHLLDLEAGQLEINWKG